MPFGGWPISSSPSEWQPYVPVVTLVGGAGNVVPGYVTKSGRYYLGGKIAFVEMLLDGPVAPNGAGTGQINISLPLAASASALPDFKVGGHLHNAAVERLVYVDIAAGASVLALYQQDSATQTTPATGADQSSAANRTIRLSFFYETN